MSADSQRAQPHSRMHARDSAALILTELSCPLSSRRFVPFLCGCCTVQHAQPMLCCAPPSAALSAAPQAHFHYLHVPSAGPASQPWPQAGSDVCQGLELLRCVAWWAACPACVPHLVTSTDSLMMTLAHSRLHSHKPQVQGFDGVEDQSHYWPQSKVSPYSLLQRLLSPSLCNSRKFLPETVGQWLWQQVQVPFSGRLKETFIFFY